MKNKHFSFDKLIDYIQYEDNTLDKTREKIITLSFYIAIVTSAIFTLNRLIEGSITMVIASMIALSGSFLFLWLCKKGYSQFVIIGAGLFYLIMAFHEGVEYNIPIQTIIYFSLMPALVAFLIKSQTIRVAYLVLSLVAFMYLAEVTGYLDSPDKYANLITFLFIDLILFVVVYYFIQLMEKQQESLHQAIQDKNIALQLLESKHQDLILFNNMMKHDIKAPLRTIKGFTSLLKRTLQTEQQLEYINFIGNSANNLEQLISDLLLYSKVNSTDLEFDTIDVNRIMESVCNSLQFDIQQNKVTIAKSDLPSQIHANEEALRTVFQNLISNSIKYQPKNKADHTPEIQISYNNQDAYDVIYLRDNGIGIQKENIPRLFKPFMRFHSAAEYEGTGLGLSICKSIMEKHGGEINIIPDIEQGTCFELKFPKAA